MSIVAMVSRSNNSTIYLKKIGCCIKELRLKKGYKSYETFALDHDIDRKQYWRIENGANITVKSLLTIVKLHKISLPDFFKMFAKELS